MGERLNGIQEVGSSILPGSTKNLIFQNLGRLRAALLCLTESYCSGPRLSVVQALTLGQQAARRMCVYRVKLN